MSYFFTTHLKLTKYVGISILVHGIVFISLYLQLFDRLFPSKKPTIAQIDVEIYNSLGNALKDGILTKEIDHQIKVPKNILPQLTSKTIIEQKKPFNKTTSSELNKQNHKNKTQQKNLSHTHTVLNKKTLTKNTLETKKQLAYNQLKKDQALKRLLKERARKNQQFAKKTTSPQVPKTQLKKSVHTQTQGLGTNKQQLLIFSQQLQTAISEYYSIPELFKFSNKKLSSSVKIVIDQDGGIVSTKVVKSSGDSVFDALSTQVINNASPLPKPPLDIVGLDIVLHFSPFKDYY